MATETPERKTRSRKLSQNEKIRRAFARGMTRGAIAKRFKVPYQTVYKATSNKHAPKEWRERLATINEAAEEEKNREVPLIEV